MDCDYFKAHIQEELDGAREYAKVALEQRAANPSQAKLFGDMSFQELGHARNFYEMFLDYYDKAVKPYGEIPKYFRDHKSEIVDLYTEGYSRTKYLIDMSSK